jgi:hypothetical protein
MAQRNLPRISRHVSVTVVGRLCMPLTYGRLIEDGYTPCDKRKAKHCSRCWTLMYPFCDRDGRRHWLETIVDAKTGEALYVEHDVWRCDDRRAKVGL